LLLDSTGEGICGVDLEGRFTFVNKTAALLFGYKPHELLGKPMHKLVHHHRPDGTPYPNKDCPVYRAFRTGQTQRVEDEVFWRRDTTAFPIAYSSYPLIEGGTITGAVVVFSDLSERTRTEKRFQAPLESAPDALVIVDQTGKIVLSMHPEDQCAIRMFKAGAAAYLTKGSAPEELVAAVKKVCDGGQAACEPVSWGEARALASADRH